jgi:hypothetical protein
MTTTADPLEPFRTCESRPYQIAHHFYCSACTSRIESWEVTWPGPTGADLLCQECWERYSSDQWWAAIDHNTAYQHDRRRRAWRHLGVLLAAAAVSAFCMFALRRGM